MTNTLPKAPSTQRWPRVRVASTNAGSVAMSALALMIGVPMASMSQLRRSAVRVRASTTPTRKTLASSAPSIDTVTSAPRPIDGRPNAAVLMRAATPSRAPVTTLSSAAASRFCTMKLLRCSPRSNWPVSMPVPSRAPSAPKMAPRIPIAAGTSTSRPR